MRISHITVLYIVRPPKARETATARQPQDALIARGPE
jgi:hypothetical protein